MGKVTYNQWLYGNGCCEQKHDCGCSGHSGVCDCEHILLEISNLHTDDLVLQREIDELSGCCSGGSGTTVTVDSDLSPTSTNPVANSAITDALNDKLDASAYTPVSLSGYATEQWVLDKHYITGVDLSDYAKKEDIPVIPTLVSSFLNDAGYLTEHQPLSGYATNATLIQNVTNLQQQIDSLIAAISGCCQQSGTTLYRWVTETGDDDYWCSGTTKYTMEQEESSTDGIVWTPTGNERSGSTVLEENCVDCGYVPPTPPAPSNDKAFVFNRYEGDTTTAKVRNFCDSGHTDIIVARDYGGDIIKNCSTTIDVSDMSGYGNGFAYYSTGTSSVIQDGAFSGTDITQANVYSGCTGIGKYAFANNPKLEYVGIPANPNYISQCVSMPTIYNGTVQSVLVCNTSGTTFVQHIDDYAFANNPKLEVVGIYPCYSVPTLGTGVFDNCPRLQYIYVPDAMVNAFKQEPTWSAYISKITSAGDESI